MVGTAEINSDLLAARNLRSAGDPEAGRVAHFMRGESEEIAANLLHVDGAMSRANSRCLIPKNHPAAAHPAPVYFLESLR